VAAVAALAACAGDGELDPESGGSESVCSSFDGVKRSNAIGAMTAKAIARTMKMSHLKQVEEELLDLEECLEAALAADAEMAAEDTAEDEVWPFFSVPRRLLGAMVVVLVAVAVAVAVVVG
jgi:hypothetical protein